MPSYCMRTHSPYQKLPKDVSAFVESLLIYVCFIKMQLHKIVVTFPSPLNPSINHFLLVIKSDYNTFYNWKWCVCETEK